MPARTIDTRFSRLLEHRRHVSARPGRPPKGPTEPPEEDERAIGSTRRGSGRALRRTIGVVLAVLLGTAVLAPGAVAHVGDTFSHLWTQHIKPRLAIAGTVNEPGNPVAWTKLHSVPAGLADGVDDVGDEIQATSATGGGPDPSAVLQFFGSPANVSVTRPTQRVLVTALNAFGTDGAAASALNLFICYQQVTGGMIQSGGHGIAGNRLPANTRVPMGMSKILQLGVGEYWVGMCGTGGSGWTNTGWGTTSALIIEQ